FAVALTDFIQGLLMAFALFILPILAIIEIGGFNRMGTLLDQSMGTEFLQPFFGESVLTLAGLIGIISYLFFGAGFNVAPHILVSYWALPNPRHAYRTALSSLSWMIIAYSGASFIGMSGAVLLPDLGNPEHIFPTMSVELLPWWISGIVLAGA